MFSCIVFSMADYNRIREWLDPKLDSMGISVEQFANKCGLTRAMVYFYRDDKHRPSTGNMAKMCHVLGVPLEEGLRQYTPRRSGPPGRKRQATRTAGR